ncbi:MAG TPA: (2Fe-2S)-binding protein [Firmicutes bacterium]|nr:(2Fe-2S)-binding protein [Bacillota bacterium]
MGVTICLHVNGHQHELDVEPRETLLDVLRDRFGLLGVKVGCEAGECGACTVLLDGMPIVSCLFLAVWAHGKSVLTIEGLGGPDGRLHALQEAFLEAGAVQCGYCTPGMILSAKALLDKNPHPSRSEIRDALSGNLCRCTGYKKIVDAVELAAAKSDQRRLGNEPDDQE